MADSLLSALVKASLVTKETARRVRAEVERKTDYEQRIQLYPKNRLGEPLAWAKWFLRGHVPDDVRERCCECGLAMAPANLRPFRPGAGASKEFFTDVPAARCLTCTDYNYYGKRKNDTASRATRPGDRERR